MKQERQSRPHLSSSPPHVSVFVSSTWVDLQPERRAIEDSLQRLPMTKFVGMEYLGSRSENTRHGSLNEVDRSQLYIGVFAGRYGSGITEAEYRRAQELGLPCLIYIKDEAAIEERWREAEQENAHKLAELKAELRRAHIVTTFTDPNELARLVTADVSRWLLSRSSTGLRDKLSDYVAKLRGNLEFAELEQQHYFELQLGNERPDFAVRVRLKSGSEQMAFDPKRKYTVGEAVNEFRRLAIIGEPGAGKTTALKRLAVHFAAGFGEADAGRPDPSAHPIPVYAWLPHFNSVSGETQYERVVALVRDVFQKQGVRLNDADMELLLRSFRLILLLDGLNEIGSDNIGHFLDGLRTFNLNHEQHLVVVASRTYNFQLGASDLPVLELLELAYPHGIEKYIQCYLPEPSDSARLMQILKDNLQMRQMATNPLLLLLVILTFRYGRGTIPQSRGVLLDRSARGLLGKWDLPSEKGRQRIYRLEDKHILLSRLGYVMKSEGLGLGADRVVEIFKEAAARELDRVSAGSPNGSPRFPSLGDQTDFKALLEELKQDHILFQSDASGVTRFWHQTLQEYFAASYIRTEIRPLLAPGTSAGGAGGPNHKSLKRALRRYVDDPRWHEILAIASGLISDDGRAAGQETTAKFLDIVWRSDKLLAAMCISNVERFNDSRRLDRYISSLQKDVYWWGIILPRVYPWALLASILTAVWSIPQASVEWLFGGLPRAGLPAHTIEAAAAFLFGFIIVLIFFRLYAAGIQSLETITNERFIRPSIEALRYIRNDAAERLLTEFSTRIANDFSVGEVTRSTIQTGMIVGPVRDESELIFMLGDERTRLQAMDRLGEIGSASGMNEIQRLIQQGELSDLAYATAIRALVRAAKLRHVQDAGRRSVEARLRHILGNGPTYSSRFNAYRGLLDLGIADVERPKRGATFWIMILAAGAAALVMLLTFWAMSSPGVASPLE